MQDGIIKGTGNSRYLKSVANFLSLYPNYEAFAAALIAGELPIDLNGINEAGWQQLATALNKANLLSDETAAALGDVNTPDEALAKLAGGVLYQGNLVPGNIAGINWGNGPSAPNSDGYNFIAFGNGVFVAVNGVSKAAAYSKDGINWLSTQVSSSVAYNAGCFGGDKFIALSQNYMCYSLNGIDWIYNSTAFGVPSNQYWNDAVYGSGKFVAVGSVNTGNGATTIGMYSLDGLSWTQTTMPSAYWFSVAYGNGRFVAAARNNSNASGGFSYSDDGINWSSLASPSSTSMKWMDVVYGAGKFVAIADGSNVVAYSTDGMSWSLSTLPGALTWRTISYGNGLFAAMAADGATAYSEDGISWTNGDSVSMAGDPDVCFGMDMFVAVSNSSELTAYSQNTFTVNAKLTDVLGVPIVLPSDQLDSTVKIATGSYTGTGTYGSSNPNSLIFGFQPKMIMFNQYRLPTLNYINGWNFTNPTTIHDGVSLLPKSQIDANYLKNPGIFSKDGLIVFQFDAATTGNHSFICYGSFENNKFIWCCNDDESEYANWAQANFTNYVYNYIAIG